MKFYGIQSFIALFFGSVLLVNAQIVDFKAAHIGESKDVAIRFYLSKPVENVSLEFSISLDGGETYQSKVNTFRSENHPSSGVQEGENLFVWKAGIDIPDTYVDPSFLKMVISMTTQSDLQLEFLTDTKTPTVKITAPTPAFEVVHFIAGKAHAQAYSSLTQLIQPGTYSEATLASLLQSFDPNVWAPPGLKDAQPTLPTVPPAIDAYLKLGDIQGPNFNAKTFFNIEDNKFGSDQFKYEGFPDAQIWSTTAQPSDVDEEVVEGPSGGDDSMDGDPLCQAKALRSTF